MPQTREHVLLARQAGRRHLVVALNKADAADPEYADLVELEVRDLLAGYGYRRTVPVVRVSAPGRWPGDPQWVPPSARCWTRSTPTCRCPAVRRRAVPAAGRERADHHRPGNGGHRRRRGGQVRLGDTVEIVGLGPPLTAVVTGLETFGKPMERAEAGDNAALLLRGVRRGQVRRGQVVAPPGSAAAHHQVHRGAS